MCLFSKFAYDVRPGTVLCGYDHASLIEYGANGVEPTVYWHFCSCKKPNCSWKKCKKCIEEQFSYRPFHKVLTIPCKGIRGEVPLMDVVISVIRAAYEKKDFDALIRIIYLVYKTVKTLPIDNNTFNWVEFLRRDVFPENNVDAPFEIYCRMRDEVVITESSKDRPFKALNLGWYVTADNVHLILSNLNLETVDTVDLSIICLAEQKFQRASESSERMLS